MQTRGWRDHGIAWGIVLAWHMLFGWVLIHAVHIEPSQDDTGTLRVVFITTSSAARADPASVAKHRPTERRELPRVKNVGSRASTAPLLAETQPLSVTFIDQARVLAQQQIPIEFTAPDPLANRPNRLRLTAPERLRMRSGRSPKELVNAIGGYLFAPPGYEADPCAQNRSNIAGLITGRDQQALQQEIEFERKHCRG